MIATLSGEISEKLQELVVLDAGGVGYGLFVTVEDYSQLKLGERSRLYIYEHIRESTHDLYGFVKLDTKALFEQLLSVNGVGPRMALNMLSIGTASMVKQAIASGDTKFIQGASGVGKRVAERVVVDLKDKVGLVSTASDEALFTGSAAAQQDEAVQALIALGYDTPDAVAALDGVDTSLPTQERIKQALKGKR